MACHRGYCRCFIGATARAWRDGVSDGAILRNLDLAGFVPLRLPGVRNCEGCVRLHLKPNPPGRLQRAVKFPSSWAALLSNIGAASPPRREERGFDAKPLLQVFGGVTRRTCTRERNAWRKNLVRGRGALPLRTL